jgi:tetratricopeptide (TPR) repeat protein
LLAPAGVSPQQPSGNALKAELDGRPKSKTSLNNVEYWEDQHPEIAAMTKESKNALEAEPHFRLAEYYMRYQIFDKAYDEYWKAIEMDSSNEAYWDGVGRLYREWGHPQLGIAILHQALQRKPESATTWNTLGTLYDKLGDGEQARQCYLKALALNPELDFVQSNLCYNYLQEGKLDQAISYGEPMPWRAI